MELFVRAAHFSSMGTCIEGEELGAMVTRLGSELGCDEGIWLGDELGFDDFVGAWLIVGAALGCWLRVGGEEGANVGADVGLAVGCCVGDIVGDGVGSFVGPFVGA